MFNNYPMQAGYVQQPFQMQPQRIPVIAGVNKVNGIDNVNMLQTQSNNQYLAIDENAGVLYAISTDALNNKNISAFTIQPIKNEQPDYVTRDELQEIIKELKSNGNKSVSTKSAKQSKSNEE